MSPWVPRVLLALALFALAGAIVSLSVGEGGPGSDRQLGGIEETQQTYGGLRQDGDRLGDPDAQIQIQLFTDLRSPASETFQSEVVDPIVNEYVRTNKALIELHHFSYGQTQTTEGAIAAAAAGEQGREWQFARLVLANLDQVGPSEQVNDEFLREIAEVTPELETSEWTTDFAGDEARRIVDDDAQLALDQKIPNGPAIFVTGPAGTDELTEAPTLAEVQAAIARDG